MRKAHQITARLVLAGGVLLLLAAGPACAQKDKWDKKDMSEKSDQQMTQEDMMAVYMEAAKPGPEHELLAKSAGTWDCTLKTWMDPSGDPMVSKGSEKAEMILGGRYLESHFDGTSMGMPFQGLGLIGYDNLKKMYVGTWCDNMGTGIMSYEGSYDPTKKEMVCHGDFIDAATGKTVTAKMVSRFESNDHHVFEMWSPGPTGDQVKWMEIVYDRKAGS